MQAVCPHHREEVSFTEMKLMITACRAAQVCNLYKSQLKSRAWTLVNAIVNYQADDDTITVPSESLTQPEETKTTTTQE